MAQNLDVTRRLSSTMKTRKKNLLWFYKKNTTIKFVKDEYLFHYLLFLFL